MDYEKTFEDHLPDSLFLNHYSLAKTYGGTPSGWRKFLRDHEVFIAQEIAAITEANARLALNDLGSGKELKSQTVTAIKALLERSEQLTKNNNNQTIVALTYLPYPEQERLDEYLAEIKDYPMPPFVQNGLGYYAIYDENSETFVLDEEKYTEHQKAQTVQFKYFEQKEWNEYVRKELLAGNHKA